VDAVRGILEKSTYAQMEIVVVADDDTPQAVIDSLVEVAGDRLRLVRWSGAFNFSGKMNRGAVHSRGDYLVLLNDDVELITPDWIEVLLGLAQQPGVGLVGTMLYFEDGTVQHGGHLYRDSWAGHIAFGWQPGRDDALGSLGVDREVSGVTAACAMISADTFWEVGGFSTLYAGNYNDVDLSLKVRSTGRSIIWTPHARLFHFESKSRVATVVPEELATIRRHWGTRLLNDPYWR
jgi:GT2 family glycosyltransferase